MKNKRTLLFRHLRRMVGKTCIAAALMLVLALTGALSALPGIGKAFKPLTAHAEDRDLAANTTYVYDSMELIQQGTGGIYTAIPFSAGDTIVLNANTTLRLDANMNMGTGAIEIKGAGAVIDINGRSLSCNHIFGDDNTGLTITGGGGVLTVSNSTTHYAAIDMGDNSPLTIESLNKATITNTQAYGDGIFTNRGNLVIQNISDALIVTANRLGISTASSYGTDSGNVSISNVKGLQIDSGDIGIDTKGTLTIENVTGRVTSTGDAGIDSGGDLTIRNSSVTAVGAGSSPWISGIYGRGNVTITDSAVTAKNTGTAGIGIYADGNIDISGNNTIVSASCIPSDTSAIESDAGIITIHAPLGVQEPQGGRLTSDQRKIEAGTPTTLANNVVIQRPVYLLRMGKVGGGTTSPAPGAGVAYPYHENDVVGIMAMPDYNYKFQYWMLTRGGGMSSTYSNVNSLNFTMPAENVTLTAYFAPLAADEVAIVVVPDGNGTANASTASLDLSSADPGTCTLTATPNSGYVFDRWEIVPASSTTGLDMTLASTNAAVTTLSVGKGSADLTSGGRVEVHAHFKQDPGGGGGGGGTTPTPTPAPGGGGSTAPVVTDAYVYTAGQEQTWVKGSGVSADFTVKHTTHDIHTYSRFTGIQVDGVTVDRTSYATAEGSVVIALTPAYLETLAEGRHTLLAQFSDGSAETTFTVLSVAAPANMTRVTPPQTSDANAPVVTGSGILLLLSLAGMCAIVWRGKRIR